MRAVFQRVLEAAVRVEGNVVGQIGPGLLVFLGVHLDDNRDHASWFAQKIVNLRIFEDIQGKMNQSCLESKKEILLISQFTLYGNCLSGRRPDFLQAASPEIATSLYEKCADEIRAHLGAVQTGLFGADMKITAVNDGPCTLILEK